MTGADVPANVFIDLRPPKPFANTLCSSPDSLVPKLIMALVNNRQTANLGDYKTMMALGIFLPKALIIVYKKLQAIVDE
jgi:hypothetical protein